MTSLSSEQIEHIRKLSVEFRQAIDKCRPELTYIVFENFPNGACGDACDLLGRFLEQKGAGRWQYVFGVLGEQTHAWLEQDDWIVDITADQFDDAPGAVIVTRDRSWHQRFAVERRRPCQATGCPEDTTKEHETAYNTFLRYLDAGPFWHDSQ